MSDQPTARIDHWIDGVPTRPAEGGYFPVCNPLDDQPLGEVAHGSPLDIERAVAAAGRAAASFRRSLPSERERWLLQAADLLEQRSDRFIDRLIEEIGSPLGKARQELLTATRWLRAAAGVSRRVTGETLPTDVPGRLSYSVRQPLGVVAGFTPFNVPLIKGVKQSALPLATGNAMVLMPSEEAPGVADQLARLYHDAGFPPGVMNVVHGPASQLGDQLTSHPAIRAVSFTGSTPVGRHVGALCGAHGKRMTVEMGGKNPLVVLEDANLEKAVNAAVMGGFLYQGQICMAASRVYVQRSCWQPFLQAFVGAAERLSAGDLRDERTMIGPIINRRQRERIRNHLEDARRQGATIHCGDRWQDHRCLPTILSGVTSDMRIAQEETFGPVVSVTPIETLDEAIAAANQTAYGLTASLFTEQLSAALRFAEEVNAGMVHLNGSTLQEEPQAPFGGSGDSGFGRESLTLGLEELTEWKWVTLQHS